MLDLAQQRAHMVDTQLARRGIRDDCVLEAMRRTPREQFVPSDLQEFAYEDSPLPIENGQTISQPYIVGLMIEAAAIAPGERVLEIGAGSGYAAGVMSLIADHVYTIERHPELAASARERLERLGYANIDVRAGDGSRGWPEGAPFDAILVAAGGPETPKALKQQLKVGGRLIIPIGQSSRDQTLLKIVRMGENVFDQKDLGAVHFVPLIGEHGWAEDERAPPGSVERGQLTFSTNTGATLPIPEGAAALGGRIVVRFDDLAFRPTALWGRRRGFS